MSGTENGCIEVLPGCPFCDRIAAGEYESFSNDPSVVWFEPLKPVTPGHVLFVPVRHVADALEDPYTTANTMEIASRWAGKRRAMALPEEWDCNLITSAGPAATQTVGHLHLHVVPRREGDGLHLPWTGQKRAEVTP
jgi:histidine triad (HIT) family protein